MISKSSLQLLNKTTSLNIIHLTLTYLIFYLQKYIF